MGCRDSWVRGSSGHLCAALPAWRAPRPWYVVQETRLGMRDLRRDLWLYLKALWKHWGTLLAGPTVTLVLLVSEEVFKIDIPRWVLGLAAVAGILVAGFLAWRDERRKVAPKEIDPEVELRRPQFEREIAKLTPEQEGVL